MKGLCLFLLAAAVLVAGHARADEESDGPAFQLHPIGRVKKLADRTLIILDEKYQPGLLGLDGFSHVNVFWWFDRNDTPAGRAVLQVHPRGNPRNPLTGVFATRSPRRPNLLGLTLCKIVRVEGATVEVEKIDAFDGTPVLDLKPYLPGYDTVEKAAVPEWVGRISPSRQATEGR